MKIKCNDGIVRQFSVCYCKGYGKEKIYQGELIESKCLKCGELFGIHDTKILKPKWKEHICLKEKH